MIFLKFVHPVILCLKILKQEIKSREKLMATIISLKEKERDSKAS